jgi:hypothetical protein
MERAVAFSAICGAIVVIAAVAYLLRRRRELRIKRTLQEPLEEYFQGKISVNQLSQSALQTAGPHYVGGAKFYSFVARAYQHAADARSGGPDFREEEELVRLLGDLKRELGLPDRYKIEAWRPGRE